MGATNSALDGVLAAVASAELAVAGWFARRAITAFRHRESDIRRELVDHGLRVSRAISRQERTLRKLNGRVRKVERTLEDVTDRYYLPHDRRHLPPDPDAPRRRWDDDRE